MQQSCPSTVWPVVASKDCFKLGLREIRRPASHFDKDLYNTTLDKGKLLGKEKKCRTPGT